MTRETYEEIVINCIESNDIRVIEFSVRQIILTKNPYYICDFAQRVPLAKEVNIMRTLENGMIIIDDINHLYEFMFLMVDLKITSFNLPRFESFIRKSNDPKLMHYSLLYVPGIDTKKMLDALYATKCLKHIEAIKEKFYVPQEKIDAAREHFYFPECLKVYLEHKSEIMNNLVVRSAYLKVLYEKVLEAIIPYHINAFTEYFAHLEELGIDFDTLQSTMIDVCIKEDSEEPLHLYEFAASTPKSRKDLISEFISQIGITKYMYYMHEYVDGSNKDLLRLSIQASKDNYYIEKLDTDPGSMATTKSPL